MTNIENIIKFNTFKMIFNVLTEKNEAIVETPDLLSPSLSSISFIISLIKVVKKAKVEYKMRVIRLFSFEMSK